MKDVQIEAYLRVAGETPKKVTVLIPGEERAKLLGIESSASEDLTVRELWLRAEDRRQKLRAEAQQQRLRIVYSYQILSGMGAGMPRHRYLLLPATVEQALSERDCVSLVRCHLLNREVTVKGRNFVILTISLEKTTHYDDNVSCKWTPVSDT